MDVVGLGPLPVGSLLWQGHANQVLTVVCKATFTLWPGECVLAQRQQPINADDVFLEDDPGRSMQSPNDLVPFKLRADVVLVGYGFAPQGDIVRSLAVRLVVGDVDKSFEAWCDRAWTVDGVLREGPRFSRISLRYERAGGGLGTANPIGVNHDVPPDMHGHLLLPSLQPLGFVPSRPGEVIPPVGFGPLATFWPGRRELLGSLAAPPARWDAEPMPAEIDPAFFNCAPPDQQLDRLHDDERIVLENLHPHYPHFVTKLPGLRPRAFADRGEGLKEITLTADTLWIDTGSGICTVTWRGHVASPPPSCKVVVALDATETPGTPADPQNPATASGGPAVTDKTQTLYAGLMDAPAAHAAFPFVAQANVEPPIADTPASVDRSRETEPFGFGDAVAQEGAGLTQPPPALFPEDDGWGDAARRTEPPRDLYAESNAPLEHADSRRTEPPPELFPEDDDDVEDVDDSELEDDDARHTQPPADIYDEPSAAGLASPAWLQSRSGAYPREAPVVPLAEIGWQPTAASAPVVVPSAPVVAPAAVLPVDPQVAPQMPSSPWAGGPPPGAAAAGVSAAPLPVIVPSAGAGWGMFGAAAASDAAAGLPARSPLLARSKSRRAASSASDRGGHGAAGDVLELLWYDDAQVPRIRAWWEELVTDLDFEASDPRKDLGIEDPEKAKSRHNVFGILSDGDLVDPTGISRVVADAVSDKGRFTPPLTLVAGDLRFHFDEVETLRATIVAVTPLIGADKKLKDTVEAMSELLKTPYLHGSTGVVEKLTRDLRAQLRETNRGVAATFLDENVERLLLEQRRYAIRKLFGGEFIRATLGTAKAEGSGAKSGALAEPTIPVYLPKQLDQTLPMLVVMRARLIVEAHLQQDPYDTSPYALRVVALGRSFQLDSRRGTGRTGER